MQSKFKLGYKVGMYFLKVKIVCISISFCFIPPITHYPLRFCKIGIKKMNKCLEFLPLKTRFKNNSVIMRMISFYKHIYLYCF